MRKSLTTIQDKYSQNCLFFVSVNEITLIDHNILIFLNRDIPSTLLRNKIQKNNDDIHKSMFYVRANYMQSI